MLLQRPLLLALSLLLVAHHASVLVSAAADARQLPQAGEQQQPALPPLIAALSALRDPLALSIAPSSDLTRVGRPQAAAALAVPGTAAAGPAPLETLRPAAAAALARQHENPSAQPMTDDDIAAINILLGREGPPSRPYCYDTGLPANATTSVPHLLTFGNRSTTSSTRSSSSANSSMQSVERLSRMSSLGPLSWLARTFAVSGDSLVKLRITQQLQLILQDAICDSAASAAELPPNQVVTFASSNLTLSLDFTGVDWDAAGDTAAAASGAQPPAHKGLLAVQKALQQLSGNFDPGHTLVSFEEFPRGPTRAATPAATASAAKGQKQRGGAASAALLSGAGTPTTGAAAAAAAGQVQPPTAANSARKLLLRQDLQQQQQPGALMQQPSRSSDSSSSRALLAADGVKTVYVRMYGADPMNLTTLVDRLGNCSAAPAAAPGRMPQMPAGQPLVPSCAEVFRQHFELQGVRVQPGGFSVAPKAQPAAAIELSVAIGLTLPQQAAPADSDAKASAWLNSTAMQDILGTFNLTVASSDADFLAYLRDPQSGRYPSTLSGLNVSSLLPALFQQVLEASKDLVQQQQQPRPQPQQQPQGSSLLAAPTALSRSILAGIIVAVVASVLALLGVVVLLLRRRSDRGAGNSSSGGPDSGAGPNRRRKRRPRVYHNKYLPDGGPVLGRDPESDAPTSSAGTAAAAAEGLRHTLERGDSVMSQVHMELDDAADEQDQEAASPSSAAASASASPSAAAAAAAAAGGAGAALAAGVRAQQRQWRGPLQRQEGEAGSGGSSVCSRQHLLGSIAQPSDSSASTAAARVPDDASVWESSTVQGSVSGRTVSAVTDLTAHSSVLSPWASSGEQQQLPQGAGCADSRLGGATKHRLAVVSQAAPPTAVAGDAVGAKEGPSCGDQGAQDPQQQQQQAACGSLSMASAFAAMNAQLDAAVRAGSRQIGGGTGSSGGGSSSIDSASAIQPLGMSCWHKDGHVSGFYVPDAAAGSSGGGGVQRPSAGGGLVSPFAAAIQLAKSVASDEV